MTGHRMWSRFDIARHDGELDDLLLEAVAPVVQDLVTGGTRCYVQRHWQRGPHVRLTVESERDVERLLARHVETWQRHHPSTAVLDEAALLPGFRRQALAEQVEGPLLPLLPDNSVTRAIEDDRSENLGTQQAHDFFRDFYVLATPMVLSTLQRIRAEGADRLATFLSIMLHTAETGVPGGLDVGYVSFRSHAEAFLAEADVRGRVRSRWTEIGLARRGALSAEVVAARAGRCRVAEWPELLSWARDRASVLVSEEGVRFRSLRDIDDESAARASRRTRGSDFHRDLAGDDRWFAEVEQSNDFRVYRICLNLAYQVMTQLGGSAMERYLLCHIAADAVAETVRAVGTDHTHERGASR